MVFVMFKNAIPNFDQCRNDNYRFEHLKTSKVRNEPTISSFD